MEKEKTVTQRLEALRGELRRRNIAAYIVPTEDFHRSEEHTSELQSQR